MMTLHNYYSININKMDLSKRLELFATFFQQKIKNAEQCHPWFESNQWKTLEMNIIRKISLKLQEIKSIDYPVFINNVENTLSNIQNSQEITPYVLNGFNQINHVSPTTNKLICEYLDTIEDDYILKQDNFDTANLYIHKLLIPICERWRKTINYGDILNSTNELNKLTEKYNVKHVPNIDSVNYINSFVHSNMFHTKDKIVFEIAKFLEKLTNDYIKLDKFNLNKIKQPSNISKEPIKPYPTSQPQNIPKYTRDELNGFTITRLRELCEEHKLNKTGLKSHIIDKLTNYYQPQNNNNNNYKQNIIDQVEQEDNKPKNKDKSNDYVKSQIPEKVRKDVWSTYIGNKTTGKCLCCDLEQISIANFHCGHIVSEKTGGKPTIQNLRPICQGCNSSMGTRNMEEYINTHGYKKNPNWNGVIANLD